MRILSPTDSTRLADSWHIEQNGAVIEMTEPQVWTLIGVFAAALAGMITFTTQAMWRALTSRIDSLRDEMRAEFASMRTETAARFDSMRTETATRLDSARTETAARFDSVQTETAAQFESLRTQIAHLDRDVQAISRRVFPE